MQNSNSYALKGKVIAISVTDPDSNLANTRVSQIGK